MDEKIEENDFKAIRQTIDAYIGIIVPSQDFPHHFEAFLFPLRILDLFDIMNLTYLFNDSHIYETSDVLKINSQM